MSCQIHHACGLDCWETRKLNSAKRLALKDRAKFRLALLHISEPDSFCEPCRKLEGAELMQHLREVARKAVGYRPPQGPRGVRLQKNGPLAYAAKVGTCSSTITLLRAYRLEPGRKIRFRWLERLDLGPLTGQITRVTPNGVELELAVPAARARR